MKQQTKKKKIRYNRILFFVGICTFLILGIFVFTNNSGHQKETNDKDYTEKNDKDYMESILKYENSDIDKDFLSWIAEQYGKKVLQRIDESLEKKTYDRSLWHEITGNSYFVLQDLYHDAYTNNRQVTVIDGKKDVVSISFVGDVSLADNWEVMPYYKSRNKGIYGILSEDIVKYMNDTDLMILNNEFSFSNRGTPTPNKTYTFRGKPENVSIYKEMGVDLVTLANNHVYDYGKDAFLDTLSTLDNAGIPRIGAGKNIEEAKKAYYFVINGYKIAFVNASRAEKYRLTPEATSTSPGIFRAYDPNPFASEIQKAKEHSDYVVALIHWGTEETHELQEVQKETGKLYIDSGADLVVGTHAHALQGVEFYKGKFIAYNLGDFIFCDDPEDTGILTWKLNYHGESEYQFIPALQKNAKTTMLYKEDAKALYHKMTSWSINGRFLEDGKIIEEA